MQLQVLWQPHSWGVASVKKGCPPTAVSRWRVAKPAAGCHSTLLCVAKKLKVAASCKSLWWRNSCSRCTHSSCCLFLPLAHLCQVLGSSARVLKVCWFLAFGALFVCLSTACDALFVNERSNPFGKLLLLAEHRPPQPFMHPAACTCCSRCCCSLGYSCD